MIQTLDRINLTGLDEFPEDLFITVDVKTNKHGCYFHNGNHGLACFSTQESLDKFLELFDPGSMTVKSVSFDEAREIAKTKPHPIVCLILLDDFENPLIHFVK